MNIRSVTLVGLLVTLSAVCSSLMVSAQGNLSISGTVFARQGSSVQGAVVIACLLKNDSCDDAGSGSVQVKGSGSSAKYQLTGLAAEEFVMLAWRDLNSNSDLDAGDEVGVYQKSGKATQVKAPAQNIDIRLVQFNGDLEAILQQADEAPAQAQTQPSTPSSTPSGSSGGLTFSGTVKALAGSSLSDAIVLAGVWEDGKYNQDKSKAVKVEANGKFSVTGLEKIPYVLFAWRDVDGDQDVSAGDEVAPFKPGNKFALATPPLANITLQFEQGDSSLDSLVALTKAGAGAGSNDPKAGSSHSSGSNSSSASGNAKTLSCIMDIYWTCQVPPTPTSDCPLTKFPDLKPKVGVYQGFVYGFCNRPMAKHKVILWSRVTKAQVKTAFTDAKGYYQFDVRGVLGSYVGITIEGTFADRKYSYYFDAIDEEIGSDGAVQNFNFDTRQSKLRFLVYRVDEYAEIPDSYTLELTFEPVKLLDGSKGQTQTYSIPMQKNRNEIYIQGVKYGTHKVTAFINTGSTRYKTFLQDLRTNQKGPTQTLTFIQKDEGQMFLTLE